ncbi:acetolactate synthase 1 catalytic subunit [Halolamina pelagica]|uniref:Acetolactate synthase 1 catalytic subunit n=1 Tax=Halolamina pelagica TaxID=699431 RepID=A0A0P7HC83_9EURY|nr:acetolactate synthase 1 catalytic subunit [Halolamina pelagica]
MSEPAPAAARPAEGEPEPRHDDDRAEPSDEQPADHDEPSTATTGADAAIAALEAAGVEYVFGVQGGAIMPVYDALAEADAAPTHVTMAHEQAAAHAADAYGQVTGTPGVCMATSGPGATNLVTGIADADMDSDPLVALTGQVPTAFLGNDAFQETDTVGVTRPITKENYVAGEADAVGPAVGEAVELAGAGRPGPTLVDLPKDASTAAMTTDADPAAGLPEYYEAPERADGAAVDAAADAFARAERPLVLAGGGVVKAAASEELRAFVERFDVPVVTTMPGLGRCRRTTSAVSPLRACTAPAPRTWRSHTPTACSRSGRASTTASRAASRRSPRKPR